MNNNLKALQFWAQVPESAFEHLTKDQEQAVRLIQTGMTWKHAAAELRMTTRNFGSRLERAKLALRKAGFDPENGNTFMVPPTEYVRGRSTLVRHNEDGTHSPVLSWTKSESLREDRKQAFRDFIEELKQGIDPAKPQKEPKGAKHDPNLMSGIFIGDAHIGAYAWGAETRHSDFDSDIASADIRAAIDNLVDRSPPSEIGLLVNVGDFMHANTSHNATWSGTPLDVDTRFSRVLRTAGRVMRYCVSKMLTKFQKVIVVVVRGNHDSDAAIAVQEIASAYFHNEPRVDVLDTDGFFHYIEWGSWLLGFNHGDKVKPEKLVNVMARDQAEAWGRTTDRMWCLGHFHHQDVKELDGCIVQKFAALPPPDAWHASMGFSSMQAMQMIIFKKTGGRESTLIYELPRPQQGPDRRIA